MDEYFDLMDLFLKHAASDPDIDDSMKTDITSNGTELTKIKDGDIEIAMYDEAYNLKRAGIYQDFEERICAGDFDKVREILKLIEDIGGDIERLRNLQRNEEDVEKYKSKLHELEFQLEEIKHKEEVQNERIRNVRQEAKGLIEQQALLKRDVTLKMNEHRADRKKVGNEIHSGFQEALQRHSQDILQVRMKVAALKQDSVKLRDYAPQFQEHLSGILDCLRPKLSEWQRALRNEASRLEAECLIVVVMVTIGMSLVLRVCLLFEQQV